jgi:3-hydroxyisobutyrate dehydrogenase
VRVTVVGLGHMGGAMARNLAARGLDVAVQDRDPERAAAIGTPVAATPAEAAAGADAVLLSVPGPPEVEAVVNTTVPHMERGSALVCTSTISPGLIRRIADDAAKRGVHVLDAPVTGAADGARAGTLTVMVGAETDALERCRPVLDAIATKVVHTGPVGTGSATKLLTNMLWAIHVVALADALAVGVRAGVHPEILGSAIDSGAGGSWVSAHDLPNLLRGDDDESFTLALCRKDLGLIAELVQETGVAAPLAVIARERFDNAHERFGPSAGELAVARLTEEHASVSIRAR